MRDLRDSLPTSMEHPTCPIKVIQYQQDHIEDLRQLETDSTKPLQWFGVETVEKLVRPSDYVILYTILVEDKVAGIIYLEPRSTKILDVGYLLIEDYRKKGVIQLVLVTVLGQLFGLLLPSGRLEQVWAFVNRKNDESLRFHEKLGMQELPSQDSDRIFAFSQEGWRKVAPKMEQRGISRFQKG